MGSGESYIWQRSGWPGLSWNDAALLKPLGEARHRQGLLLGRMRQLGFGLQLDAQVQAVTEEALKSSDIEGETLDPGSVRSSVARRLGLPQAGLAEPIDRRADGVVEVLVDATSGFDRPLTQARLIRWHAALFPHGRSGLHPIRVGGWRDDAAGPMQVISGPLGKSHVHFQAPPARSLAPQMRGFLRWFNNPPGHDGLLRAAVAHLWFVTLHPLDDGNGRVARAITDMALAQLEGTATRFYSLSSQIRRERTAYYDILEATQKGTLDATGWLVWFLECYARAIGAAEGLSAEVLQRSEYWNRFGREPLTPRQKTVLNRVLSGFEGKLTAKKWAALGKCSIDTAQRDLTDLVQRGLLRRNAGGSKNTSYSLVLS